MFSQTVKYTNFEGEEKERTLYFHLGQPEIAELSADPTLIRRMTKAQLEGDKLEMLLAIRDFVKKAYGVRSEDMERFVKSPEETEKFLQSAVYEEFLGALVTTEGAFDKFLEGVMPSKLMAQAKSQIASGEINPVEAAKNLGIEIASQDNRPLWVREERPPTREELMGMDRPEMILAFQKHPGLSQTKIVDIP